MEFSRFYFRKHLGYFLPTLNAVLVGVSILIHHNFSYEYHLAIDSFIAILVSFSSIYGIQLILHIKETQKIIEQQQFALSNAAIVAITNTQGKISYVNDLFVQISGYSREELIGKDHRIINSGHHSKEFFRNLWETISNGKIWRGELKNKRKNGTYYWVDSTIVPIQQNEKITHYIAIRYEVSDRKKGEEELNQFFELSRDLLCIAGTDGYFKKVSKSFCNVLGYSEEELLSQPFFKFIHPEDIGDTVKEIENLSQGLSTAFFQNRYRTVSGQYLDFAWTCSPTLDGKLYAIARDMTESKLMFQRLEKSEKKLALAIDGTSVGVWDWNVKTGREEWSAKFYELLGYEPYEIIASIEQFNALLHPEDHEKTFKMVQEHFAGRSAFDLEYRLKTKSGEYKWFHGTGKALLGSDGTPLRMVGSIQDIHAKKQAEVKLIEAKAMAESAAHTKSLFLANMSHEIRTPMNGIIGVTHLLATGTKDPIQLEQLKIIENCGQTLLSLINDILDFSKLEIDKIELELQPFGLRSAINDVIDLLSVRAKEKGITLYYQIDSHTPYWIFGDVHRLKQILVNLISNAIKFTEKGAVKLSVQAMLLSDKKWEIQCSVQDTGIGIAKDVMNKLFVSFSQVDASTTRKFGGTGLGLAISKGICEKMGGKMWVESELEKGSTFYFTFFAQECEEVQSEVKKRLSKYTINPDQQFSITHPLSVLVVEDNQTNQMVITGLLEQLGYLPDVASHGGEALKILEKRNYDLIFMDCHMPIMDGFETTKRIVEKFKDNPKIPKIIALTASVMKEDINHCYEVGMKGFLSKPITRTALIEFFEEEMTSNMKNSSNHIEVPDLSEVWDQNQFLSSFSGMDQLASNVVYDFLKNLPQMSQEVEAAIVAKNASALEKTAHSLKGAIAIFYALPSRQLALELEMKGRSQSLIGVEDLYKKLKIELDRLKDKLEQWSLQKKAS